MIGTTILTLLRANTDLVTLVDDKIYPYIAPEKTPVPFIVYIVEDINPEYTKDGWADDNCSFSVFILSSNYTQLQDIIKQVRISLECKRDSSINRIELAGQKEGYNITEDCYLNKLSFNTKVVSL